MRAPDATKLHASLPEKTPEAAYVEAVLSEVRWKRAHTDIARELTDHLADQRAAFEAEGMPGERAATAAVSEMGEPLMVGRRMDAAYRPRTPGRMLLLVFALAAAGLLLQLVCRETFFFPRDLMGWLLAGACFAGAYFLGGTWVERLALPACFLSLLYAFVTAGFFLWPRMFFVGVRLGAPINAWRYVQLAAPVAAALMAVRMRGKGTAGALFTVLAASLPLFFLMHGNKNEAFLAGYLPSLLVLLIAVRRGHFGGERRAQTLLAFAPFVALLVHYVFHPGDWSLRTSYFLEAWAHNLDPAVNEWAAFREELLTGARLVGQGALDFARYPDYYMEYLSDADHLLLYLAWRFGYLSALAAGALPIGAAVYGFARARRLGPSARLIAVMILTLCAMQSAVYILSNLGLSLNEAQLPLPVLGYGNVSLVFYMGLLGLLLSFFRTGGLHDSAPGRAGRAVLGV